MEKMVALGCPTFKEFMIYASEGWQADDRAIYNTLEHAELWARCYCSTPSRAGCSTS